MIVNKKKLLLAFGLIVVVLGQSSVNLVRGDETNELDQQLEQTSNEIEQVAEEEKSAEEELAESEAEEEQLEGSISYYEFQINLAAGRLEQLAAEIAGKEEEINRTLQELEQQQSNLVQEKERLFQQIRILYKNSFVDPLEVYFRVEGLEGARLAVFHQAIVENLYHKIYLLTEAIEELEETKGNLENELSNLQGDKAALESERQRVQVNMQDAQQKVLSARSEQQQLMQQLAGLRNQLQELTRREQEILARKAAAALASTTVGEIELSRAAISSPPPQDGNIYFSFWTYGYPHRVGMNQYGAYGRAKAGQDFRQILTGYYAGVKIEELEMPEKIKILEGDSVREIDFEDDYLLGIGEMPSCWGSEENSGLEALKAQAVAARTYALKYTGGGESPICINQKCQVYVGGSKVSKLCGEYWQEAVEKTRGLVVTYDGKPISAWYASTAGGYTLSSQEVWGGATPYALGIKDADAEGYFYDGPVWGNSPWFYKSWGDQPWLSKAQVEDLLNTALLPESYNAHLPEADKGGFGPDEVLVTLQEEGIEPLTNLISLEVIGEESKATLLLRAYVPGGYRDLDAQRFRFVFNLRSPGTDAIWTSRFGIKTS